MRSIVLAFLIFLAISFFAAPAQSQFTFGNASTANKREAQKRLDNPDNVDDIFRKTDFDISMPTPLNLEGVRIPGLTDPQKEVLAKNWMVAISSAKPGTFADIYRENKLEHRSNFVTVDAILHSIIGHHNGVIASAIQTRLKPELLSLLKAMIDASISDYKLTGDTQLQGDVERNIAYLTVALKLLSPDMDIPAFGESEKLANADLENIKNEKVARSAILKANENFALYHPLGWYDSTDNLRSYYRCREWLGRMQLTLTDVTNGAHAGSGNEFRRAVLLFRSLARAKFGGATGMSAWKHLSSAWSLIDGSSPATTPGVLLPSNFVPVFQTSDEKLKATLETIADPLARARLLISLKSREHTSVLESSSVFELSRKDRKVEQHLLFHLFLPIQEPEIDWLSTLVIKERDEAEGFSDVPAGLLFLHQRGFKFATNILADNAWRMDDSVPLALPLLDKLIKRQQANPDAVNIWQVMDGYTKAKGESNQLVMRTPSWLACCTESTMAAWLDTLVATDSKPEVVNTAPPKVAPPAPAKPGRQPRQLPTMKMPVFHYLEPAPEIFKAMGKYLHDFESNLGELGLFPEKLRSRNQDFIRLTRRLTDMSVKELLKEPLEAQDTALLANIDEVLTPVGYQVGGHVFLPIGRIESATAAKATPANGANAQSKSSVILKNRKEVVDPDDAKFNIPPKPTKSGGAPSGSAPSGSGTTSGGGGAPSAGSSSSSSDGLGAIKFEEPPPKEETPPELDLEKKRAAAMAKASPLRGINLALGSPAAVWIVLHRGKDETTIARGGVYSYYESLGAPENEAHFQRKLEYGFVKPLYWCEFFQMFDQSTTTH
jgi:hypothetical protein